MNCKSVFLILLISIRCVFCSFSQNYSGEDYSESSVTVSYNFPIGKLGVVYKPTPGIAAGYDWARDDYETHITSKKGLRFGFVQFHPKKDTSYYSVPPDTFGITAFSKYQFYYATFHFETIKNYGKFGLLAGGNVGFGITQYSNLRKDVNTDIEEVWIQGKLVVAPLVGVNYEFTENISTSLSFHYNALISFGGDDIGHDEYNPVLGIYKQYTSVALRVGYSF